MIQALLDNQVCVQTTIEDQELFLNRKLQQSNALCQVGQIYSLHSIFTQQAICSSILSAMIWLLIVNLKQIIQPPISFIHSLRLKPVCRKVIKQEMTQHWLLIHLMAVQAITCWAHWEFTLCHLTSEHPMWKLVRSLFQIKQFWLLWLLKTMLGLNTA